MTCIRQTAQKDIRSWPTEVRGLCGLRKRMLARAAARRVTARCVTARRDVVLAPFSM